MKTRFAQQSLIALALVATPLINGCTQQSAGNSPTYVTTSSVTPPPVVTQLVPVAAVPVDPPVPPMNPAPAAAIVPSLIITNALAPVAEAEPVMPANLRISKPLNEVIRLAQSGVDETVILTYVTNSPALFTLGAEEIVYLNDLGIASSVITAMMQHDQALRSAAANAAPPAAVSNEDVAAAPTYVNPPPAAPTPEAQPVYVSNDYFYDTLSPYGTWVEVDGYGRCWRPTVAITSSSWQPYRDRGRWVHTDAGWYWMSDYSWGAVAFHYGRWFSHPRWGWCWWPDTVWGPSWVTWRYDNDHCGWAPLPPRTYFRPGVGFSYHDRHVSFDFDFGLSVGAFTFVPWGRFYDPYPYRHCLPRARAVAIYHQTTVINNVVIGNNNTVINRGIPTDRVREHTRAEVRTVSLREEKARGISPRRERLERDGRTLVVHRPLLPPTSGAGLTIPPGERSTARSAPPRAADSAIVNPAPGSAGHRPDFGQRPERKEIRATVRENETRSTGRASAPNPAAPVAPTVIKVPHNPVAPTVPERKTRNEEGITTRSRENRATVVRPPEAPTPVRKPTPIFSKPVVIETPAYTPTRSVGGGLPPESNPGGNRPNRPTARENPIWSSPASQPNPAAGTPSRHRTAVEPPPQVQNNQPAQSAPGFNRPNVEVRREEHSYRPEVGERNVRSRSEARSAAPSFTPPAPRAAAPVIAPPPALAPAPRPSFTPVPAPGPSAPRIESRPAPSRPEPSRSESRSDSGRSPRNR